MWGFLTAILSGMLMSIQGVFNTEVTKQSSMWVATGWVHFSALIVCIIAWFFKGREAISALWSVDSKYMLLGGVIGAFITVTVIMSMKNMGPAQATMIIVTAQILLSYVIEVLGLFGVEKQPFEWRKVLGTAITIAGILIFKWKS